MIAIEDLIERCLTETKDCYFQYLSVGKYQVLMSLIVSNINYASRSRIRKLKLRCTVAAVAKPITDGTFCLNNNRL